MIFKLFKEKSNKKYLDNILAKRCIDNANSEIKSLGVIIHIDKYDDYESFRELASHLNIHNKNLKVIAYTTNEKTDNNSWDECFTIKDFGWHGKIKNISLKSFIETKFDALISYYEDDVLELKLITGMSKAHFKIGLFQEDNRLNDLIINTCLNEFIVFKNELFKYLTILKKIKNE
jgi:hypothetical protein